MARKLTLIKWVMSFESTHRLMLCTRRIRSGSMAKTTGIIQTLDPGVELVQCRQVSSNANLRFLGSIASVPMSPGASSA
jgi:hypothetical protein